MWLLKLLAAFLFALATLVAYGSVTFTHDTMLVPGGLLALVLSELPDPRPYWEGRRTPPPHGQALIGWLILAFILILVFGGGVTAGVNIGGLIVVALVVVGVWYLLTRATAGSGSRRL